MSKLHTNVKRRCIPIAGRIFFEKCERSELAFPIVVRGRGYGDKNSEMCSRKKSDNLGKKSNNHHKKFRQPLSTTPFGCRNPPRRYNTAESILFIFLLSSQANHRPRVISGIVKGFKDYRVIPRVIIGL